MKTMKNTQLHVLFLVVMSLVAGLPRAQAELVAHFPLDNDAVDVVSGFEGDVGEGVSFSSNGGVLGGAAEFEGFGGIQLQYEEALNPEDNFSVTAWVNPPTPHLGTR